jgi:hypothetical protein
MRLVGDEELASRADPDLCRDLAGVGHGSSRPFPTPFHLLRAAVDVAILVYLLLPDVKRAFAAENGSAAALY